MYRPPENSNRVKAIKSKFENNSNDSNKVVLKPPLRKSKTLQDFNINSNGTNGNVSRHLNNSNNNVQVQATQGLPKTQPSLSRQLSDPAKRNIKRTPAFRLDKNALTEKTCDQKNARLLHNKSRYLDSKLSKLGDSLPECDEKNTNFKERLSRTKPNTYGQKPAESKSSFSDLRNKFNGENKAAKTGAKINQQAANPNTHNKKSDHNNKVIKHKTVTTITYDKNEHGNSQPSENQVIKHKTTNGELFNNSNKPSAIITENNDIKITHTNKTDDSDKIPEQLFKFLYSEPVPKSQRTKPDNTLYANTVQTVTEDVYNSSTLKLSESPSKNTKSDSNGHVSDDESHYVKKTFIRNNPAYGSLRTKKSLENLSIDTTEASLTDTLKNALKKPLPKGPAPKKPPRTFVHSPIKLDSPTEISPLNIDKDFTKKLTSELQKNRSSTGGRKPKGDPKYMLEKLETALKNKGILLRRPVKAENTSEEDSDSEKKLKFFNLRDLPTIPLCSSSQTLPNLPYSPPTSPKFNFNCLTSLGCATSTYEPVKEPNSSFFVTRKKEEPVYAEPFEYQVEIEEQVKNGHDNEAAIDVTEVPNSKTIRRSVHYASTPVPDVKNGEANNHVSEVKNQDQIFGSSESNSPSSTCTSDMDSIVSTPSEENKTIISGIKVKDLIKAIENNKSNKNTHSLIHKTNSTPSGSIKTKENGFNNLSDDQIKQDSLERSFSTNTLNTNLTANVNSESNISLNEDDGEKHEMAKFETYVKRVRSKVFTRPWRKKEHLFHCCLLVALNRCTPYVKSKFPPKVQEPYKIAELCFPEVENAPMDCSVEAQCYSLIITNEHGERTFGYCRRVLPEASTTCLPLAYCILSKHRAPGFYRKILEELEYRHGYPDKFRDAFVEELYNCKFPLPGETMFIDCAKIISSAGCDKVRIGKIQPSENNCDGIYGYSTNKSGHDISMTNSYCDTKDVVDYGSSGAVNGKVHRVSENNDGDNDLDLNSYVVVCNNGEYGTLLRNNKGSKTNLNVSRGASATINIAHDISPSSLRKSTSSPNLLADIESLPSELVLMRPHDSRHEENDLKLLGETLKTPVLQQVFCTLLLERKVILVSSVLSKLSSCIEALQIILYPFSWQHTIIPVVPSSLWEIVDTPTPLVCGVLSSEVVDDFKIENGIVVDLDEGAVLLQVGDEDRILPCCLLQTLKDGLSLASKVTSNKIGAHNVFFSDAFLRVFIQSCGHYRDYIVDGQFQKSEFIQHSRQKGKRIRQFLKWFTETTMFYNFLEIALHDSSSLDLFDQRIKIYSSESATEILNKMKYWTNYKSFLSTNFHRFQ